MSAYSYKYVNEIIIKNFNEEQDIYTVLNYLSTKHLLITKRVTSQ